MTERVDLLVLGACPTALVSAALLARRGMRVLVVGPERDPDLKVEPKASNMIEGGMDAGADPWVEERAGVRFPRGPGLLFGWDPNPAIERLLLEIGLSSAMLHRDGTLRWVDPVFQVVLENGRFPVHGSPDRLSEEIGRVLPRVRESFYQLDGELAAVRRRLSLPPESNGVMAGIWSRFGRWIRGRHAAHRRAAFLFDRVNADPVLHRIYAGWTWLVGGTELERLSVVDLARFRGRLMMKAATAPEGIGRLGASLLRGIVQPHSGGRGTFQGNLRVENVDCRRKGVREVAFSGGLTVQPRWVILERTGGLSRWRRYLFAVPPRLVPSPMSGEVLLLEETPLSYLVLSALPTEWAPAAGRAKGEQYSRAKGEQYRGAPVRDAFSAECAAVVWTPATDPEDEEGQAGRILRRLHRLMPFSEGSIRYLGRGCPREGFKLPPSLARARPRNLKTVADFSDQPAVGPELLLAGQEVADRISNG